MIAPRPIETRTSVTAVTLAAAFGFVLLVVLFVIARPGGYGARVAAVARKTDAVESLMRKPGDAAQFRAGALCRDQAVHAAALFNTTLQNAAGGAGVTLASTSIVPGRPDTSGVSPIAVQFDATGPYSGALAMLARLGSINPQLFLDSVDLKSQVSSVELRLKGRFYCLDPLQ
jgi:hypothetical protein